MKQNLILSTILLITLSVFTLDVMPSTAVSPSGAVLLHTSLDDVAAIESPAVGIGGSTTLAAGDFVAAQTGKGANFTADGKVAVLPARRQLPPRRQPLPQPPPPLPQPPPPLPQPLPQRQLSLLQRRQLPPRRAAAPSAHN